MKKNIAFLLTVFLICAFFAGCTKSENSNLSDDPTAAGTLEADPAVVKELEDLLMSETWHEEGSKQYAYVFNEDHTLDFFGGEGYYHAVYCGNWYVDYIDEDGNKPGSENFDEGSLDYRIVNDGDRVNNKKITYLENEKKLILTWWDGYYNGPDDKRSAYAYVAGAKIYREFPENAGTPDDLVGTWDNGGLILHADGTGYQSPMGYILGELQYPDDIVWRATDHELYCGLVFNDKNQPAEEYTYLNYGIVMYEYSFIDENTLSLYSPWDDTTVEIERMK